MSTDFLSVDGVRVLAFKTAEDKNGYIIRLRNDTENEIKTKIRIPGKEVKEIFECDVLERIQRIITDKAITFPPKKLITLRLK